MRLSAVFVLLAFTSAASARPDTVTGRRSRQLRHSALSSHDLEKRGLLSDLFDSSTTKATTTGETEATTSTGTAGHASSVGTTSTISTTTGQGQETSSTSSISTTSSSSSALTSTTSHLSSVANATLTSTTSSQTPTSAAPPSTQSSATPTSTARSMAVTTITTDSGGQASVITLVLTSTEAASAAAAETSASKKSSDGGISTGAIVGISVAAGAVLLGLIGLAMWRMKRRGRDEDEAIRWPELNRHGDVDTHHALPARQTGQHGIETGLERSLSNSSDMYGGDMPHSGMSSHSQGATMALNGSGFGVASSLDEYPYDDKIMPPLPDMHSQSMQQHPAVYDHDDDYTNMPPQLLVRRDSPGNIYPDHDSDGGSPVMMARQGQPVTYHQGY